MAVRCGGGCDGREDGAVEAMLQWQKVSDFLIGASFLSIPLELLHFATCADLAPLRWVLLQFGAFIILCGVGHLLAVFTYDRPNSRRLLLAVTAAKLLAALASFAAAVALPTFIPQLLRVKVRETLLRDKARRLDRDLAVVRRRQETAGRVVRALAEHTRSSSRPDAQAIMRTAMLHLSDALGPLQSCAVWMPAADDGSGELRLVRQLLLPADHHGVPTTMRAVRISDPEVAAVMASKDARVLRPGSPLATTGGAAAAIRMPMLRVSNFVGGSSESDEPVAVRYAILVLVLSVPVPPKNNRRSRHRGGGGGGGARGGWSRPELEIVEAVADQVAVALSHAAVLEEWQLTRYKLAERQRALAQAGREAAAAAMARDAAQSAMRDVVLRPLHSVVSLLSVMQDQGEAFRCAEQRVAVDAMARASAIYPTLMDDVMAALTSRGESPVPSPAGSCPARRPFDLRALVREAATVAGCLSRSGGLGFLHRADMSTLPADCWVVGDDKRVFHLLLHMLGALLQNRRGCHCHDLSFSVDAVVGEQEAMSDHHDWIIPNFSACCNTVCVRFQFGITGPPRDSLLPPSPVPRDRIRNVPSSSSVCSETRLSIATCNRIVQMMGGKMWREPPQDFGGQQGESMSLILHFQLGFGVASPSSPAVGLYRIGGGFGASSSCTAAPPQYHFNGLRVLLADGDDTHREVTRKLLERLGCQVVPVPSAAHCLSLLLGSAATADDQPALQLQYLQPQVVLLDLHTPAAGGGADAAGAMDDGFEVALRIRELTGDSFSWPLILVALPLPARASSVVCQRVGVNGVIHKPITLPALGAQLHRVLHEHN